MTSQQRCQVLVIPLSTGSSTLSCGVGRGRAAVPQAGQRLALQETCTMLGTVLSSQAALTCLCLQHFTNIAHLWVRWGFFCIAGAGNSCSLRVLSVITGLLCINPALPQPAGITRGQIQPGKMRVHSRGVNNPLLSRETAS